MIYLASPYSDPSPEVKQMRFRAACVATGHLINQGHVVFSPIASTHPVKVLSDLGGEWDHWKNYDTEIISRCDAVWVLQIEGWEKSVGLQAEIQLAEELGKGIAYIKPSEVGLDYAYPHVRTLHEMKALI